MFDSCPNCVHHSSVEEYLATKWSLEIVAFRDPLVTNATFLFTLIVYQTIVHFLMHLIKYVILKLLKSVIVYISCLRAHKFFYSQGAVEIPLAALRPLALRPQELRYL